MAKLRRLTKLEILRVLSMGFAMGMAVATLAAIVVLLGEALSGWVALGAAIALTFGAPLAPAFLLRRDTWALRIGASVCALFGSLSAIMVIATWIEAMHQA